MWYSIFILIRKELQSVFSSKEARSMLMMPVLLQLMVFPFAATLEVKNSTLAVFNEDNGAESAELIQRFAAAKAFPQQIFVHSQAQLQQVIDDKDALLAVHFPQDFSAKLNSGEPVLVQAVIDGRRSNSAQIAFAYAQEIVQQYSLDRLSALHDEQQLAVQPVAEIVTQNFYNPELEYRWFVLPCLVAIIITVGCLTVTALSVAREREEGTFDQLLVSPLTPVHIMIGKIVPGVLVALLQGTIISLAAVFVYHIPFSGSVALLFLTLVCYGLSLSGFGLFISSLCSTQQQAFLGVFGFMAPAVMLSGYISPIENMPYALQLFCAINPLNHAIVAIKGIFLKGYTMSQVLPELMPLVLIGMGMLVLAYIMFVRRSSQ